MNTNLANRATLYEAMWIKHRKLKTVFSLAKDVKEFKRMVSNQLFKGDKPDPEFIKGARLINWEALYKAVKS